MKTFLTAVIVLCVTLVCGQKPDVGKELDFAAKQLLLMMKSHSDTTRFPFSVNPDGSLKDAPSSGWVSGFFAGSLWYLYEYTGNPAFKEAADLWSQAISKEQYNTSHHDLGFMLYCSFGNGYRLGVNQEPYKKILLNGAASLSSRYNPSVGLIKSWDKFQDYKYPVIIDNMMNLEYLFWAAKISGDEKYKQICISHADKTLKNHFRKDNSCYHVVCYDEQGNVVAKKNHQGYEDGSAWSRGQAWALYSYTMMYRETNKRKYLKMANKVAGYILNHPHLPEDKIPYWDYHAPHIPNEERDASAAAVTASALLELQKYVPGKRSYYIKQAEEILKSLSSPAYKANLGENNYFILKHSMGSKTLKKEVDQPLVYADYYFIEALLRYSKL